MSESAAKAPRKPLLSLKGFLLAASLSLILAAYFQIFRIPDLSQIQGYQNPDPPIDLLRQIQSTNASLTLQERDINAYLNEILSGEQEGSFSKYVTFEGAYLNLEDNRCSLVFDRLFLKKHCVSGVEIRLSRTDQGAWNLKLNTARIGSMRLPGLMVHTQAPALKSLAAVLKPEIDALMRMKEIHFENDQLVLIR